MRRCVVWLLGLPLAVAAAQTGHRLAYLVAIPNADERARSLAESGHGYLDHIPVLAATAVAAGIVLLLRAGARTASGTPRCWPFALMPLLLFAAQEPIERFAVHETLTASVFTERTYLFGLALQVPTGLVVWVIARVLLHAVAVVRRLLNAPPLPRPVRREPCAQPRIVFLTAPAPLACSLAKRGPPSVRF